MWLVSCMNQYPAPDPKCQLIISSFLTLSHLIDCLICTKNLMPIVLLLEMMGGYERWKWLIFWGVQVGGQGLGIILELLTCAFVFCSITFSVPLRRWLEHNGCCVCFYVFFFIFFVSGPFN